ncbi:hypothetical protein VOI32_14055 [Paraburkholderia caribensis]|uniref:Uncharacterized protein n=1 Tax=Paraburkholderia caribensis TaxID=75105 RepID=A0A9Q6WKL4_9BURK|nr:hypothetical protein [Paraburkholderia caribensis]MCO4881569.1 hypothetical protein [Paraburkholderia caribensis]PTB24477.1 hypothetical protein C9I56_33470 [Paraburkholderia caribensis]QLB61621.1 hypothetical protein A9O66_04010 [Paraburkholderia caribensis]
MADIHVLPVLRKRGRRRVKRIPGAPAATVLNFCTDDGVESAEQRLAKIDEAVTRLARAMLMATRVVNEMCSLVDR